MGVENSMPEGWVETSIGKLAVLLTDYVANGSFASLKENVTYLRDGEGYARLIRLADHNKNYNGEAVFVNEHSYMFLKKSKLYPRDLIISNVGEYSGTLFRAPNLDIPMTLGPNSILMKFGESDDYMFYFLQGRVGQHLINTVKSGSANPKFNKTEFKKIEFIIPPLPEQKAIAKVLTAFDDKIELLQAQNKTLETMAQTIFMEWFGKYQIGDELPEGWRVGKLGEVVTPLKGKNITKKQVVKGPYPVIAGGLKPSVFHNVCNTKSPVLTVSASGANAGFVALHHHPVWSSDSTYIDISFTDYFYFIYVFLKSNQSLIYDKQEGSAIPHVYPRHLENLNLIIPTRSEMEKYEELAANIFHKISNNKSEIDTLSKTRDTLLPKLMSGQVRVNNIKQTANA